MVNTEEIVFGVVGATLRSFEPSMIDAELVDKCVKAMKLGKASGPDDLTVEHLLNTLTLYK